MSSRTVSNNSNNSNSDSVEDISHITSYSTSLTSTGITIDPRCEKLKCCRCLEIRVGIFILGLWSIFITIGYYIGFLLLWGSHSHQHPIVHYPILVLYGMAGIGFFGGSFGIFAAIFQSVTFAKIFFTWAIIRFFSQFIEGIIYAAAGYSLYILFFIDFVLW
eukprot:UN12194